MCVFGRGGPEVPSLVGTSLYRRQSSGGHWWHLRTGNYIASDACHSLDDSKLVAVVTDGGCLQQESPVLCDVQGRGGGGRGRGRGGGRNALKVLAGGHLQTTVEPQWLHLRPVLSRVGKDTDPRLSICGVAHPQVHCAGDDEAKEVVQVGVA